MNQRGILGQGRAYSRSSDCKDLLGRKDDMTTTKEWKTEVGGLAVLTGINSQYKIRVLPRRANGAPSLRAAVN